MPHDLTPLEDRLGYRFADPHLLVLALTHSSFVNERDNAQESNERLEFLGDAVLELAVSAELYACFAAEREGQLTRLRSRLVKEASLAAMAREIGLSEYIRLGRGEETQGGRERDALLSDAFEAVLGAVFLDGGFGAARDLVTRLFAGHWPQCPSLPKAKDFKTRLQEHTQQTQRQRPIYSQESMDGPDHAKVYEVVVSLPDGCAYRGLGGSKKKAEQEAARQALMAMGLEPATRD